MEKDIKRKKHNLRKKYLLVRENIPLNIREEKTIKIIKKIISFDKFKSSKNIMLYYPIRNEVDILELLKCSSQKNFFFPSVDIKVKEIIVKPYSKVFINGYYGIKEPSSKRKVNADMIDLVFVPGVVFDREFYRIGYGAGYFDRFLFGKSFFSVGICFSEQLIDKIPSETFDVQLDAIVTDKEIIERNKS